MFIHEYTQLDQEIQANILNEKGICFDTYRDKEKTVSVYLLFDFYVEVTNTSERCEITPYRKGYRYTGQSGISSSPFA